jgi:adenylate cyclase
MERIETVHCDLAAYKITLEFHGGKAPLVVHFDTPSRRFYFSIIALIITETKKQGKPGFVHIRRHQDQLALLDKSISGKNASEHMEGMWAKIRMAWRNRLPDLEAAALFKVLDRDLTAPYEKGGKYRYQCSEEECDVWASLFSYDENNKWRFKFAFDSASVALNDVSVTLGKLRDDSAWAEFMHRLSRKPAADEIPGEPAMAPAAEPSSRDESSRARSRKVIWSLAAIAVMSIIVVLGWRLALYKTQMTAKSVDLHSAVYPSIGKTSLAVLPFENLTGDPQQEYFSDGIADQLLTSLSQGIYLYVTARTSSFAFKGNPMQAQEIAAKLGVQYLIEGSVQRDKERVRINVQLIEGRSGNHVWSETYDRSFSDLFALQDEITMAVMAFLNVQITGYATGALKYSRPNNLKAYEHYLRGLYYHLGRRSEDVQKARQSFEEAIHIDPNFGRAYTWLANTYLDEIELRLTTQREQPMEKAEQEVQKALAVDPDYPPYGTLSRIARLKKDMETAIAYGRKSVQQAPNDSGRHYMLCLALFMGEEFKESVDVCETALQLAPFRPVNYVVQLAWALVGTAQYDKSILLFKEVIDRSPQSRFAYLAYKGLTAAYEMSGQHADAQWAAQNVMRLNPNFSLENERRLSPNREGSFDERVFSVYSSAGLK